MKIKSLLTLALVVLQLSFIVSVRAQGTAFTYQGRLNTTNGPANGNYDFTFSLHGVASGGSSLTAAITNNVPVSNGLFTVTVDFLSAAWFEGSERWLEISVRTNGGGESPVTLSPRQKITAAPYSITAGNLTGALPAAQLSGTIPSANLGGTYSNPLTLNNAGNNFTGNGAGLANVNAATLGGLAGSNFWKTAGNSGTTAGANFLGTTDNQPLELKVNTNRALRLEPTGSNSVNVVGGYAGNFVTPGRVGATIGGGGAGLNFGFVVTNTVAGNFGTVGGGGDNAALSYATTVAGGYGNVVEFAGAYSTIGGGTLNRIGTNSQYATIGGGAVNIVDQFGFDATISGGFGNFIGDSAADAVIGGGFQNSIQNDAEFATIGGGTSNTISPSALAATISGGRGNQIGANSIYTVIAGGFSNRIDSFAGRSTIGGGLGNTIQSQAGDATISGGRSNTVQTLANYAAVGGGLLNSVQGLIQYAMIPGGYSNIVAGAFSFAAGRRARAGHAGTFVWADDTDAEFPSTTNKQFAVRANNGVMIQATNTALDLRGGGAIRVAGARTNAVTPVFIHRATAANTTFNVTTIDHPHANNDANAVLFVTQNWNPGGFGGTYNPSPIGVYYTGTRWSIFNQDDANMPTNAAFNVMIVKP